MDSRVRFTCRLYESLGQECIFLDSYPDLVSQMTEGYPTPGLVRPESFTN